MTGMDENERFDRPAVPDPADHPAAYGPPAGPPPAGRPPAGSPAYGDPAYGDPEYAGAPGPQFGAPTAGATQRRQRTRWREVLLDWRSAVAVFVTGILLGGLAGAAITVIVDHHGGHGPAMGQFRGHGFGPHGGRFTGGGPPGLTYGAPGRGAAGKGEAGGAD